MFKCDQCSKRAQFSFSGGIDTATNKPDYRGLLCATCAANWCAQLGDVSGYEYFLSRVVA